MAPQTPASSTLSQLYESVSKRYGKEASQKDLEQSLQTLASAFVRSKDIPTEAQDAEAIRNLSQWVARFMLPDKSIIPPDELSEKKAHAVAKAAISLSQQKARDGIKILDALKDISHSSPESARQKLDSNVLLSLIAFTDTRDPWTTPSITSSAEQLLSKHSKQLQDPDFIVKFIIQSFLRPLFSHSQPSAITSTGRKAMPSSAPPPKYDIKANDRSSKPWKYDAIYAISVFSWAVKVVPQETLTQYWNLFIPPILTLIDDIDSSTRCRGLSILSSFLPKFSSKLLLQTGLGEVFEDAVTPTLLYLPSITPLEESIELLPAAYKALFALCGARFDKQGDNMEPPSKDCIKFLDKIMRHGIFTGYLYASEHPSLVEILLKQISIIVKKQGIFSVKHLKDVIPMITATLSDPFGSARPSLLFAAVRALRDVILNAWPRVGTEQHRMGIIKGLVLCRKNIADDEGSSELLVGVGKELGITAKLYAKVLERDVNVGELIKPLVEVDPTIKELFGI